MELKGLVFTVVVVAVIGAGALFSMDQGPPALPSGTTTSTCTTGPSGSTSSTSVISTSTESTSSTAGTFTSTSAGPVKVLTVNAYTSSGTGGETFVTFIVSYQNAGTSDVYTIQGCGSSLTASVPQGSGVIQETPSGPRCLCAEAPSPVAPGDYRTATTPGCWSGYQFVLVHPGTAQVDFTLSWGYDQGFQRQGTTNMTATFSF